MLSYLVEGAQWLSGRHVHIKPMKIKMCMYQGMNTVGA